MAGKHPITSALAIGLLAAPAWTQAGDIPWHLAQANGGEDPSKSQPTAGSEPEGAKGASPGKDSQAREEGREAAEETMQRMKGMQERMQEMAEAQREKRRERLEGYSYGVGLSPLGALFGMYSGEVELLDVDTGFGRPYISGLYYDASSSSWDFSGQGIGGGLKKYFAGVPSGWYFRYGASANRFEAEYTYWWGETATASTTAVSLDTALGKKWTWNSGFYHQLELGLSYIANGEMDVDGQEYSDYSGTVFTSAWHVGWMF
jgi:hypothetical protein